MDKTVYLMPWMPFIANKQSFKPNMWKAQESRFLSMHDLQYNEDGKVKYPNLWKSQASDHEIAIL